MTQLETFIDQFKQLFPPHYITKKKPVKQHNVKWFLIDEVDETDSIVIKEEEAIRNRKLLIIEEAISYHLSKNPILKVEFDLFNMYYKKGMSYRDIEKVTNIPFVCVRQYVQAAEVYIKAYITKKKQHIK